MSATASELSAGAPLACASDAASFPFDRLPDELQSLVIAFALAHVHNSRASGSVADVLCANSFFRRTGVRHLYQHLTLTSRLSLSCALSTLEAHPHYAQYIRALDVYSARIDWKQAMRLARLVSRVQTSAGEGQQPWSRVRSLRVRFPGEAVAEAVEFFAHFQPHHLEWITQSCWLLAPHHSFLRALTPVDAGRAAWSSRLVSLRLGNFCYDVATARMLSELPNLASLTLLGGANKTLQPQTLRTLLTTGNTRVNLRTLRVADCPMRRRNLIELELGVSVPTCSAADNDDVAAEAAGVRFADSAGCVKFCPRCRLRARERIMERYAAHAGVAQVESEQCRHDGTAIAVAEADHSAEEQPETHFLQQRVLESLRWIA